MLVYLAVQVRDNVVACDTPALTADEIKVVDDVRLCLPACVKLRVPSERENGHQLPAENNRAFRQTQQAFFSC